MPLEGFRIFNCVFGVLIIQLFKFKTVYGALLIYIIFLTQLSQNNIFLYTMPFFSKTI